MPKKIRTHVIIPSDTLEAVDSLVGKRGRSKFIREATEEKIRQARFHKALEVSSGAWKDEDHPELSSVDDIGKYVSDMRKDNDKRLKQMYHE